MDDGNLTLTCKQTISPAWVLKIIVSGKSGTMLTEEKLVFDTEEEANEYALEVQDSFAGKVRMVINSMKPKGGEQWTTTTNQNKNSR